MTYDNAPVVSAPLGAVIAGEIIEHVGDHLFSIRLTAPLSALVDGENRDFEAGDVVRLFIVPPSRPGMRWDNETKRYV